MNHKPEIWRCPQCGTELDISALGFYAEVNCPGCGHADHVHTLLANFRIEGLLGIGGMSVVLRGRDVVLNRPVAIKVLNETYRNQPERIARFENECSMMAKVHHENVVSVYSAGWARGQFYIAMELVNGKNLESVVTPREPLKPLRALEITTQIVKGLEAAHNAGLLHRDMKPGNVIITTQGQAKVLDFGLAQGRSEGDSEEIIWATPYYVPPETLQRSAEDARTDIYALGMTLRYLLTGEEKLPGSPSSVSALLEAKYQLPPFEHVMPRAEECLCDLVDRMTAFNPEDRHDNYADLLQELKEVQETIKNVHAENVSPRLRRRRFRNRLLLGVSALLLGGLSFFLCRSLGTPSAQRALVKEQTINAKTFVFAGEPELHSATNAIAKGKWKTAEQSLNRLYGKETEPTIAAWGALHFACLSYLKGNGSDDVDKHLTAFNAALARDDANPAGKEIMDQLRVVPSALQNPSEMSKISDHRILGLTYCLLVRTLLSDGNPSEARRTIQKARDSFLRCREAAYKESFAELTKNIEAAYAHAFVNSGRDEAVCHMLNHEYDKAELCWKALSESCSTDDSRREEMLVMAEVCAVAVEMQSALERKLGKDCFLPGEEPDAFFKKCKESRNIPKERLAELHSLLYLVRCDYKNAFDKNPYRNVEKSNEPFAVMMRDWKTRLAPYMNE